MANSESLSSSTRASYKEMKVMSGEACFVAYVFTRSECCVTKIEQALAKSLKTVK